MKKILLVICTFMLCVGACSNANLSTLDVDLAPITVWITGTADKCIVRYTIGDNEPGEWITIKEVQWFRDTYIEMYTEVVEVEIELRSLSRCGYLDLSVYVNEEHYIKRTSGPYGTVVINVEICKAASNLLRH